MAAPHVPPRRAALLAGAIITCFARAETDTTSGGATGGVENVKTSGSDVARNGSVWPACASSCDWPAVAFTADSTEATELYQGCDSAMPKKFLAGIERDKPTLIIVGVQKGGTTSIRYMGRRLPFLCFSSDVEPHFWDQWDYKTEAPSAHVLRYEYFQKQWRKRDCKANQDKIEKTPDLFNSVWGPLRMCEALGRQKLALFLRNPVDRAFSGFLQTFPSMVEGLTRGPKSFDLYARIEVALVKECPALPSGDIATDKKKSHAFHECCLRVTKGFHELTSPWPACHCPRKGKYCTMFGDRSGNAVRKGIYVSWLRMWLRYHRAQDILIIRAEDFFQSPLRVESELACFIRPQRGCEKVDTSFVSHANSATKKLRMWNKTRKMLTEFYTPYNAELDQLLGRPMGWW